MHVRMDIVLGLCRGLVQLQYSSPNLQHRRAQVEFLLTRHDINENGSYAEL